MDYLLYIVAGVLGILFGRKMARRNKKPFFAKASKGEIKKFQNESKEALNERTEDRKEKILDFMKEAKEDFKQGCNLREGENRKGITRKEVEKLLDVSENTAVKYLNELEKEGKIEQEGDSGRGVFYLLAK